MIEVIMIMRHASDGGDWQNGQIRCHLGIAAEFHHDGFLQFGPGLIAEDIADFLPASLAALYDMAPGSDKKVLG